MRRIKFTFFFGCVDGKFFKKVFINAAYEIFFCAESFMCDFSHFVDKFFYVVGCKVACSKSAFNKAAF